MLKTFKDMKLPVDKNHGLHDLQAAYIAQIEKAYIEEIKNEVLDSVDENGVISSVPVG